MASSSPTKRPKHDEPADDTDYVAFHVAESNDGVDEHDWGLRLFLVAHSALNAKELDLLDRYDPEQNLIRQFSSKDTSKDDLNRNTINRSIRQIIRTIADASAQFDMTGMPNHAHTGLGPDAHARYCERYKRFQPSARAIQFHQLPGHKIVRAFEVIYTIDHY